MSKIRDLKEMVHEIADGSELALGGFVTARCPMAFAAELVRQGKKDLCGYAIMGSLEDDFLVGAGCMKEYSSGGAADIAAMARRVFVIMRHERRKLVERCDYITSVGGYQGVTVFTNLCILQTGGESGVLELKSLHPGVTLDEVRENTGFELVIPPDYAITPSRMKDLLRFCARYWTRGDCIFSEFCPELTQFFRMHPFTQGCIF